MGAAIPDGLLEVDTEYKKAARSGARRATLRESFAMSVGGIIWILG
jgi:hypothetical protein